MALLRASLLACGLCLGACAQDGKNGVGSVDLYDRAVACDEGTALCSDPRDSVRVDPDDPQRGGISFVSRAASQYGENGIYLYLELHRPGGVTGSLELDLPLNGGGDRPPHAVYLEHRAGARVFASASRGGRVELPASESCPCQDILLELVFTDPGEDGRIGSEDDQTRRLSRGVVSAGETFCLGPRLLPVVSPDTLEVGRTCHAPFSPPSGGGGGTTSSGGHQGSVEVGCAAEPTYEDDSGCDGSGGAYDHDDGAGCGGDDWGDASGCDGGDLGEAGAGCDGGSASCAGDAFAATRRTGTRASRRARILGSILPFALFGLFTGYLRRRTRRGGRR